MSAYLSLWAVLVAVSVSTCGAVDSLKFLVLGDWGGLPTYPYHTSIETGVAKQMGIVSDKYGSEFILALGDNFYFDGVKDENDKRFKETFEDVFTSKSLSIPWYLVAGNHDHNGNVSAQIAYTKKSNRWRFPDYYYTMSYNVPGGKTAQFVMIDTVLLCGNSGHDFLNSQPKGPENLRMADSQWDWISKQLQASDADYLFVAGHFPVYSIAEHGPTQCLVDKLLPMLVQNNALYLCGHDHNLQHLQVSRPGYKMNFFVIGAANFADTSNAHANDVPKDSSKFFWAKESQHGGFATVELTTANMTFTFVDGQGHNLYQQVLFPRK